MVLQKNTIGKIQEEENKVTETHFAAASFPDNSLIAQILKRGLDIIVSCIALFTLSPVFVAIVMILLCTGNVPLFSQQRIGKGG